MNQNAVFLILLFSSPFFLNKTFAQTAVSDSDSYQLPEKNAIELYYKTIVETGCYDLLYDGNVKVLAKRKEKIEETVTADGAISKFIPVDFYFIKKNNTWYTIGSRRSVLGVLKGKKSEISKYLRKNKI